MKLRPVTYQFDIARFDNTTGSGSIIQASYDKAIAMRRTGFIAQEVEKAAEQSHYNFSGINKPESEKDHYSLSYESFVVPLVKGMQEQQAMIENQKQELLKLIWLQDKKLKQQDKIIGQLLSEMKELRSLKLQ